MNRKQVEIYKRYQNSNDYCLDHVYGRYSREKERAWDYCLNMFLSKPNATGLKVISYNTFQFTAGFEYCDEETDKDMFMYITRDHVREWEV